MTVDIAAPVNFRQARSPNRYRTAGTAAATKFYLASLTYLGALVFIMSVG